MEGSIKCPKCESTKIQYMGNNKKSFSVGKAVGGTILAGGVGSLAGFAGKKGSNQFLCSECGHYWEQKNTNKKTVSTQTSGSNQTIQLTDSEKSTSYFALIRAVCLILMIIGLIMLLFNRIIAICLLVISILVWNVCGFQIKKLKSSHDQEMQK